MPTNPTTRPIRSRRGLTLLETLLATAVLVVIVTAVMGAVQAGRALSQDARQHVTAALGAEMLMARITAIDTASFADDQAWYAHFTTSAQHGGWHGHVEPAGEIRAGGPDLLPEDYQDISLSVTAQVAVQHVPAPMRVRIDGVEVRVAALTSEDTRLLELVRFVPIPGDLAGAMP